MSGSQRAQPSSTSLLSDRFPRRLICENTYHHHRVVSILLKNCAYERQASTGMRRAAGKDLSFPTALRKTVRPLHPSWYARRKAVAASALVAVAGKLMV